MAAALIIKIKARNGGYVCNAANEEELWFIEYVVFGVLKDDDDSGDDYEQDDSDEWELQQGADDDGNDELEASSPPSSGEGVKPADDEDQEANEEDAQRGLYCIHESHSNRKSGTSLLDRSCSHPKGTHTKQHAPPSGLTTHVIKLGANFLRPYEERYLRGMDEKNPRFFTRTCTLGLVWACEMLCWRRTLLVAKEEEELGHLGIYTKFGHSEIFGLTRPETASASECGLYDAAVKKVLAAWDSARVECGFN